MKYILILFFLISCSQLPSRRVDRLSILQGITNSKEVEFSVAAPQGKQIRFELQSDQGEVITPEDIKIVGRDFSSHVIYKLVFIRDTASTYNLLAYEGDQLIDQRLVGRVPPETNKLRLAVASCMNDYFSDQFAIWDALFERNPDYLLLIGDTVYADKKGKEKNIKVDPEILWNRYMDVRLSLPLYFNQKLIPTHALWDDHDYGINDGDSTFEHREEARKVFEAFYAQDTAENSWTKSFGVGGLLNLGDFNFYFLDGRSFRSPAPEGKHLGSDQQDWLINKLKAEASPSFIIKGDQFFGGYHPKDSFEGKHPANFAEFTSELTKLSTPFVFLSGDRHYSEIMQFPRGMFGKPSFEITSSPIHAALDETLEQNNPWRVVHENKQHNFIIIDNSTRDNHWFLDVESVGINGEVFFRRELAVFIKDLQDNLKEVRNKRRSGKRRYYRRKPRIR